MNMRKYIGVFLGVLVLLSGGAKGYFVAPSSRNQNGLYEWEIHPDACELADAPAWLLEWVRDNGKPSAIPLAGSSRNGASITDRALAYLAKIPPAVSGQGGHDQTMEAARVVAWALTSAPKPPIRSSPLTTTLD